MDDVEESLAGISQEDAKIQTNTVGQDDGDMNELNKYSVTTTTFHSFQEQFEFFINLLQHDF